MATQAAAKKTEAKTPAKKPVVERQVQPLRGNEIGLQKFMYQMHHVTLPHGVTLDDALVPDYWQLVAGKVRLFDEIRIMDEEATFVARVIVTHWHNRFLGLKVLDHFELEVQKEPAVHEGDLRVEYRGTVQKYCIMNDETVLQSGLERKADAVKQMTQMARVRAA